MPHPITPPPRNDTAVAAVFLHRKSQIALSVFRSDAIHVLSLFRRICGVVCREFASVQIISSPINNDGGVRPVEAQYFAPPEESLSVSRIDNMPLTVAPIRVSRVVKHGNGRHFITLINSVSLLVRRKILRLYFGLPANYRTNLLLLIMMASASRDAKSCVSQETNSATTAILSPQSIAYPFISQATNAAMTDI